MHGGIAAKSLLGDRLEHLARYVSRSPIATERLSLTEGRLVRRALKTPYRDGTTHVIFEPEDSIARFAALAPIPRAPDPLSRRVCPGEPGSGPCGAQNALRR